MQRQNSLNQSNDNSKDTVRDFLKIIDIVYSTVNTSVLENQIMFLDAQTFTLKNVEEDNEIYTYINAIEAKIQNKAPTQCTESQITRLQTTLEKIKQKIKPAARLIQSDPTSFKPKAEPKRVTFHESAKKQTTGQIKNTLIKPAIHRSHSQNSLAELDQSKIEEAKVHLNLLTEQVNTIHHHRVNACLQKNATKVLGCIDSEQTIAKLKNLRAACTESTCNNAWILASAFEKDHQLLLSGFNNLSFIKDAAKQAEYFYKNAVNTIVDELNKFIKSTFINGYFKDFFNPSIEILGSNSDYQDLITSSLIRRFPVEHAWHKNFQHLASKLTALQSQPRDSYRTLLKAVIAELEKFILKPISSDSNQDKEADLIVKFLSKTITSISQLKHSPVNSPLQQHGHTATNNNNNQTTPQLNMAVERVARHY